MQDQLNSCTQRSICHPVCGTANLARAYLAMAGYFLTVPPHTGSWIVWIIFFSTADSISGSSGVAYAVLQLFSICQMELRWRHLLGDICKVTCSTPALPKKVCICLGRE